MVWQEEEESQVQITHALQGLAPLLIPGLGPKLEESDREQKRPRHWTPSSAASESTQSQDVLRLMALLILRQERDLSLLKTQDSWMLYLGADSRGLIPVLLSCAQEWKQQMDSKQSTTQLMNPLRVHLLQRTFQELQQRFTKAFQAKPEEELIKMLRTQKILTSESTWPSLKWDQASQSLVINTAKKVITMDQMAKILTDVLELLRSPTSVVRYHALPVQKDSKTTPWQVQLPMTSTDLIELFRLLEMNSIWTLISAQFKRHQPTQSSLATQIAGALNLGKGKGKGKGKAKQNIKEKKG